MAFGFSLSVQPTLFSLSRAFGEERRPMVPLRPSRTRMRGSGGARRQPTRVPRAARPAPVDRELRELRDVLTQLGREIDALAG